ncbi:MAG: DUF1134 domain-containing protein [Deltaproteobacteria bacterium]|nr:DUF1134 domain-containing protein [Deltaproteobacteria bacterium]MBF0523569.1 DUF1134 domain-containing protein [Deltaproteobacteria bacterium]
MRLFKNYFVLFLALSLVGSLILAPSNALAEKKSGTVLINLTQVAFILGVQWGSGVLTLNNGKKYHFKISGLQAVGIGASQMEASGRVYDLDKVSDFEGTYMSFKTDASVGGGAGYLSLKNSRDVMMILETTLQGVSLTVGGNGMEIRFE